MSNPSPAGDQHGETSREPTDEQDDERTLETVFPAHAASIRKAGFWGAIVLPVAYLPVLAIGISTGLRFGLFLGLIGVHLLALYVGHAHRRSAGT